MYVRAKKALGQHFLKDQDIAMRIVESLQIESYSEENPAAVLEIGPGTGVLTQYLLQDKRVKLEVAEIDDESIEYLKVKYPQLAPSLFKQDFLQMDLAANYQKPFYVIGNFPYNISSQIFFKILDYKEMVPQVVGMIQKEVAERLASPAGKKSYGILSVLLQAWYDIEYLFTVEPHVFNPPPKVQSAVIRIKRNSREELGCDPALFKTIIKSCFNQRRKTIRNSIKPVLNGATPPDHIYMTKRPEQLNVEQFIELTNIIASLIKS